MSAPAAPLTDSLESRVWDAVERAELVMARAWLDRALGIARGHGLARAAGRPDFTSCEVAATLCIDDLSATELLGQALLLVELPPLVEAIRSGAVRLPHARVLLDELRLLDMHLALQVLCVVLAKVANRTPAQVRGITRRAVLKVDAEAAAKRRREAVGGRRVFVAPDPDGMALFGAHLPAEQAVRAYALVDAHARGYGRDGRTLDQKRADALLDLLRGGSTGGGALSRWQIDIVVPLATALGSSDEPATLTGYGPIDAEHARELLTHAALRQVSVDPVTGQVLRVAERAHPVDSAQDLQRVLREMLASAAPAAPADTADTDQAAAGYVPTAAQRRLVHRRDRTCTFPCCTRPGHLCDLDHRQRWPLGPTAVANLHALSRKHHRAKQAGWTPKPQPDGSTHWTSPTGRTYRRPPAHDPPDVPGP